MSKAEDIHTLFRRFGGNADTYQEIVATEQAEAAHGKWPMLGQIRPSQHHEAPAVRRAGQVAAERQIQRIEEPVHRKVAPPVIEPAVMPVAAAPVSAVSPASVMAAAPAASVPEAVVQQVVVAPVAVAASAMPVATARSEAPVSAGAEGSSLKSMFDRMVPAPEPVPAPPAAPLKRLVKW